MARHPLLRWLGIGLLGFIGGMLSAIILQDVLASAFASNGSAPTGVTIVLGSPLPVLGLAGIVVALLVDRRSTRRRRPQ